jgi:hypothetical protein
MSALNRMATSECIDQKANHVKPDRRKLALRVSQGAERHSGGSLARKNCPFGETIAGSPCGSQQITCYSEALCTVVSLRPLLSAKRTF